MPEITQSVRLEMEGSVALVIVDNPPVNALSWHVRDGLFTGITQAVAGIPSDLRAADFFQPQCLTGKNFSMIP